MELNGLKVKLRIKKAFEKPKPYNHEHLDSNPKTMPKMNIIDQWLFEHGTHCTGAPISMGLKITKYSAVEFYKNGALP